MKIFYQDLLRFFPTKPSIEDLSEKLFQLGHEHEIENDVIDIEITPNRGDCLSLLGLARDLNVFYEVDFKLDSYNSPIPESSIQFKNLSPKIMPKVTFLEIEVTNQTNKYKDYLESYFKNLNINKNNFFTDISNYVSYELGQPTHCFDLNKLKGEIIFTQKKCSEEFKTLLGSKISLSGSNCIFENNSKIISLAGVMGGAETACSARTNKVLVECAYFTPESILGKTTKYNIQSESAYKFERGVDITSHDKVLRRFIKIVDEHSKIKSLRIQTFNEQPHKDNSIEIDHEKVNKILGTSISKEFYIDTLKKLGFKVDSSILVPSYRSDISNQNDLSEEIARVIGYNNISRNPISIVKDIKAGKSLPKNLLRSYLKKNGFTEVINFPFTALSSKDSIMIDNPLDKNKKFLRTGLKESLLENLLFNERRQKDSIKLYEISDIYVDGFEKNKNRKIGIIVSGIMGHNHNDFSKKIDEDYFQKILNKFLNKDDCKIEYINRGDLDTKIKSDIFYAETEVNNIQAENLSIDDFQIASKDFIQYACISEFPSSTRDFSFSIDNLSNYNDVISHLENLSHPYLKTSFIFDFYKNEKLCLVKLGVRMIFQSNIKTLSDDEIKESSLDLLEPILNLDGVSIPGL